MIGSVDVNQFLEQLNRARAEGRAKIEIDFNRLTLPNCPLPFEALKGRIVYIYLGLLAVLIGAGRWGLQIDWKTLLIAAAVVSGLYWVAAKPLLETNARNGIVRRLTADGDAWEKIWRFGGVRLKVVANGAETSWIAPKDSWKDAYEILRG